MVEPKPEDIGRTVIYKDKAGGWLSIEEGVVTSFNDAFVFVRFGADKHSKATSRLDLSWAHEESVISGG